MVEVDVDVPGSALGCEAAGAALAAAELEGADGSATTVAALGVADPTGKGSRSLRLHAVAKNIASAVHPKIVMRATLDSPENRMRATRVRGTGIAAAYR